MTVSSITHKNRETIIFISAIYIKKDRIVKSYTVIEAKTRGMNLKVSAVLFLIDSQNSHAFKGSVQNSVSP